jgi:hypothetical protein
MYPKISSFSCLVFPFYDPNLQATFLTICSVLVYIEGGAQTDYAIFKKFVVD